MTSQVSSLCLRGVPPPRAPATHLLFGWCLVYAVCIVLALCMRNNFVFLSRFLIYMRVKNARRKVQPVSAVVHCMIGISLQARRRRMGWKLRNHCRCSEQMKGSASASTYIILWSKLQIALAGRLADYWPSHTKATEARREGPTTSLPLFVPLNHNKHYSSHLLFQKWSIFSVFG